MLESERERSHQRSELWDRRHRTPRWSALRLSIFERDKFTCQRCGHVEPITEFLVAGHVQRYDDDEILFWDTLNIETLCQGCASRRIRSSRRRRTS
jgi:5-methylcytosine-specific restriction enzyme A